MIYYSRCSNWSKIQLVKQYKFPEFLQNPPTKALSLPNCPHVSLFR